MSQLKAPAGTVGLPNLRIAGGTLSEGKVNKISDAEIDALAQKAMSIANVTHIEFRKDGSFWFKNANASDNKAPTGNYGGITTFLINKNAKWKSPNRAFVKVSGLDLPGRTVESVHKSSTKDETECLAKVYNTSADIALFESSNNLCHAKTYTGGGSSNGKFNAYIRIQAGESAGGGGSGGQGNCLDWNKAACRDNCAAQKGGCVTMYKNLCAPNPFSSTIPACKILPKGEAGKQAQRDVTIAYCKKGNNWTSAACRNYCSASTGSAADPKRKEACNAMYDALCKKKENQKSGLCCGYRPISSFKKLAEEIKDLPSVVKDPRCLDESCIKSAYLPQPRSQLGCTQAICSNRAMFDNKNAGVINADNIRQLCSISENKDGKYERNDNISEENTNMNNINNGGGGFWTKTTIALVVVAVVLVLCSSGAAFFMSQKGGF